MHVVGFGAHGGGGPGHAANQQIDARAEIQGECRTMGQKYVHGHQCVTSIFVRVFDRLMHTRMDRFVEARELRAPTQCGFRKGHGTLDALFTLQHCIKRARWRRQRMYAVFVDFKKAFDTVRRDLMVARCKQLGVHGQFLASLLMLYDKVTQRVVVNGVVGEPFDTHVGTKQGSELSPLLFGMFIDMLHELIRLNWCRGLALSSAQYECRTLYMLMMF